MSREDRIATGAVCAVIAYSGYGDSGNVNEIRILNADGNELSGKHPVAVMEENGRYVNSQWQSGLIVSELSLRDALDTFADHVIDLYHSGYENNECGDGEITFDCAGGTIRMEHRDHYVEPIHTETDL